MRSSGYTLIELLVVITILGILSVVMFLNIKNSSQDLALDKNIDEVQTMLRLAQSNATAAVKCNGSSAISWMVEFDTSQQDVSLICNNSTEPPVIKKELKMETDDIEVLSISTGEACFSTTYPTYPLTVIFSSPFGKVDFVVARGIENAECIAETNEITIRAKNKKSGNDKKGLIFTRGGAVESIEFP